MSSKNQSREKILNAASELFHLKGYHATGLNQILEESGAPKGSLYYHFPNGKEQLAVEAIRASAETIAADIKFHLDAYDNPVEAIQHNIKTIARRFDQIEHLNQLSTVPIGLLAAETALVNENLRQACEDTFALWENLYFNKLRLNGYSEEQARLISRTINALIEGGVTRSLTTKSSEPLLQINQMIPLLLAK